MTGIQRELLDLLAARSFKKGTFTLASGATSNYYIDGRMSAVNSHGAFLIGRVLFDMTKDANFAAIGGMEVGAVPLTAAVAVQYHLNGRAVEGFWVRDKTKSHGTKKLIEGAVKPGDRVIVLDDVITTGGSSLKAAEAVREFGCEVVEVIALVDRLQGAKKAFAAAGLPFRSVFTIRDFGIDVPGDE